MSNDASKQCRPFMVRQAHHERNQQLTVRPEHVEGLNQNSPDPLTYDLLVIGAGPAGISAAVTAAQQQRTVLLIDDGPDPGGQIWRAQQRHRDLPSAQHWLSQLDHPLITRWHNTRVLCVNDLVWQLVKHDCYVLVRATDTIICTGAREIFAAFNGWTLPQVAGAGGLQALIKNGVNVRDRNIVIAGSGPLLLASADTARRAGANVVAIIERASWWQSFRFALILWRYPNKIKQLLQLIWSLRGIPYWRNSQVREAKGEYRVTHVIVQRGKEQQTLACDWLACAHGLQANLDIAQMLGLQCHERFVVVDAQQQTSHKNVYAAGEITGIGGVEKALIEGQLAALAICQEHSKLSQLQHQLRGQRPFVRALKAFCQIAHVSDLAITQDTVICRCEDVQHQALQRCNSGREARLYTRAGMGACQGKICGPICEQQYGFNPVGERAPWTNTSIQSLVQEEST